MEHILVYNSKEYKLPYETIQLIIQTRNIFVDGKSLKIASVSVDLDGKVYIRI